jgi:D-beta-D-heptose 7-phosphate kinase/D-beta-D-heptose 1-phosphate adenosyltransferase
LKRLENHVLGAFVKNLLTILSGMEGQPVMVVGDLILDRFVYGEADRISSEGPVPVLLVTREEEMPGGAGNVLLNLTALKARTYMFGVTGMDAEGERLGHLCRQSGADVAGIVADKSRPTTYKTRYLARNQQLLCADVEKTHDLNGETEKALWERIEGSIKKVAAIVLSDNGRGVLTERLCQNIIAAAKTAGVPVIVDPKGKDYTKYKGATLVTPNRKELSDVSGIASPKSDEDVEKASRDILNKFDIDCVIATRSEDGLSVIEKSKPSIHYRTEVREVYDVTGAGDSVIATIAASIASGAKYEEAAQLANIAGGIAVSKLGTTPVRAMEIKARIEEAAGQGDLASLIFDRQQAVGRIQKWKAQGLKVGFTNGCFDILHTGHVRYLNDARRQCDRLVVGLNHDASVRLLKGPERPVNGEWARATVLAALGCVDGVVLFGAEKPGDDNTASALIDVLRPDFYFKGGDYTISSIPEAKVVEAYGGKVSVLSLQEGYSTTGIIEKSKKTA